MQRVIIAVPNTPEGEAIRTLFSGRTSYDAVARINQLVSPHLSITIHPLRLDRMVEVVKETPPVVPFPYTQDVHEEVAALASGRP